MTSFELNSRLYSKPEIEDILSLSYPYTVENVVEQKKILFVELSNDIVLQKENKSDLTNFVEEIAEFLIKDIGTKERSNNTSYFSSSSTPFLNKEKNNSLYPIEDHDVIFNKKEVAEADKSSLNDGLNVDESGAPPGVINPIKYRTIKRAVNIDSRFRPNYYSSSASDMQLTLPTRLEKVISMRLGSLELPNSFYSISEELGNNCFTVGKANGSLDASGNIIYDSFNVVIPDGNYGNYNSTPADISGTSPYQSISSAINTAMSNVSGLGDFLEFSILESTAKSSFARKDGGSGTSVPFKITFGVSTNTNNTSASSSSSEISSEQLPYFLGWQLGYRVNMYESGGPVSGGSSSDNVSIVSEGLCDISGPKYLYLSIDDYNNNVNNYFISAFTDSINSRNILSRIDLPNNNEDGFGSQINRTRNYFGPVNIEKMQIRLVDEYGRVVNLNNMDWSFTLMFECVY
tara:strand:+ start:1927 stop:3309 length:1383 start_codon:yes stop_codon:yes gene_type:complete